mgnify:CR=1 FL=1
MPTKKEPANSNFLFQYLLNDLLLVFLINKAIYGKTVRITLVNYYTTNYNEGVLNHTPKFFIKSKSSILEGEYLNVVLNYYFKLYIIPSYIKLKSKIIFTNSLYSSFIDISIIYKFI